MKLRQIDHIAIATTDIDATLKFYDEVLGLKERNRVDMGESILVYLPVSPGCTLELVDWKGACTPKNVPDMLPGVAHFAFDVEDIQAWSEKCQKLNVEITLPLSLLPKLGKNCMLIKDPNGTIIELCEDAK